MKPANVKLTPDDNIKVLDFGLAKAFADEVAEGGAASSMSPTITRDATRVGVILGTAAYMSPEQARGKRIDKRTDIFAFGAVLYEMLTGKRAFAGEDASDVLAAVIKSEPKWGLLPNVLRASLACFGVASTKMLNADSAISVKGDWLYRGWRAPMGWSPPTAGAADSRGPRAR